MNQPSDSTTHSFGYRAPGCAQSFFCPSCEIPLHYEASWASDTSDGLADFSDYYRASSVMTSQAAPWSRVKISAAGRPRCVL